MLQADRRAVRKVDRTAVRKVDRTAVRKVDPMEGLRVGRKEGFQVRPLKVQTVVHLGVRKADLRVDQMGAQMGAQMGGPMEVGLQVFLLLPFHRGPRSLLRFRRLVVWRPVIPIPPCRQRPHQACPQVGRLLALLVLFLQRFSVSPR
jgi:hypothetical protein